MRLKDWQSRLTRYLLDMRRRDVRLDWEEMSCAKFVSGAIEAVIGRNPHTDHGFDGTYSTSAGAVETLKVHGFNSLIEFADSLGFERIHPNFATFGDIVGVVPATRSNSEASVLELDTVDNPEEFEVALCVAEPPVFWAVTPRGVARGRMTSPYVVTAWRVE